MFVWRKLKCFSITLIAPFIGDEKQTVRFISVGLVCLMNSFCCTLSSWQTVANVCFIFLSPLFLTLPLLHLSIGIHQARIFSPTAQRSARPWVTPTAAGCRLLCRLMGARGLTTVATCMCPAWMQRCLTLRYLPLSTFPTSWPWPRPPPPPTIGHSPPLARTVRGHSHTTAFTITSISNNSSTAPARWRGKSMIGGPYRTNPPFSVSISMKAPSDPLTLVWSSTDTKRGDWIYLFILIWTFSLCCSSTFHFFCF